MGHKGSNDKMTSVESQVLLSTPLLEAFGNAKTLRNDNSSRFGKFIEIQFNVSGSISGAYLHTYLLEKSRVTKQTIGERSYHIFYQLCASCSDEEAQELLSGKYPEDFYYLNQSECIAVNGVDDAETFEMTRQAMTVIGITEEEQKSIKRVLAAILHLGNIVFEDIDADSCSILDDQPLVKACELLQLDSTAISKTFLTRQVSAGRETYTTPLKREQAESCRDALAMLLYSRMFDWIVKRINDNINNASQAKYNIGVLDIYGFESFEVNSFEQFCINFANEKLQQQYNQHIFKLSQQEYIREKINWSMLQFNDNQSCLDLIENSPMCILKILDEECSFPKSNEKTFAEKLYQNHEKNPYFIKPRFAGTTFTIRHYADAVTYDTTHFLTKNKDYIVPEQLDMLKQCADPFLKGVFNLKQQQPQQQKPSSASAQKSSFKFTSVASQFRDSLTMLMDKINRTYPHYIRCIKPNSQKKPGIFNMELVCQQLKCAGIYESIRITLEGYPTKKQYSEFYERYKIVFPNVMGMEPREACKKLIELMEIEEDKYQFGQTKLFLRSGQIEKIEMFRTSKLANSAIIIQKNVRGWIQRKKWRAIRRSAIEIERAVRAELQMGEYQKLREYNASTKIGSCINRYFAAQDAIRVREAADYIQATICSVFLGDSLLEKKQTLRLALACQAKYRANTKRASYLETLAEAKSMKAIQTQKQQLEERLNQLQHQMQVDDSDKQRLEDEKQKLEKDMNEAIAERRNVEEMWKQKYAVLEEQLNAVKSDVASYKKQKKSLEADLEEVNSQLSSEAKKRTRVEEEREQLEKEKANALAELRSVEQSSKQQISSLDSDLLRVKSQCESLQQDLDREKNQRQTTEQQKSDVETRLSELQRILEEERAKFQRESKDLVEQKQQLIVQQEKEKNDMIAEMQLAEQKAKREFSNLDQELSDTKSKFDACKKALEQEKDQVSNLLAEVETLKRQKRELEVQLEEINFKYVSEVRTRTRAEEDRQQVEKEKQDLITEMRNAEQSFKQQISNLEQEYNDLKSKYDVTRISLEQELQLRVSKEHSDKQQMEDEKFRLQKDMNDKINDLRSIEESWRQKYNTLESQNGSLQAEVDSFKRQKRDLELQLDEVNSKLSSETRIRTRVEEEKVQLEKEKSDLQTDMRASELKARQEYNDLTFNLETVQQSYDRERSQKQDLEREKQELASKLAEIQRTLEEERSKYSSDYKQVEQSSKSVIQQLEREKTDLMDQMYTAEQKAKQRYTNLELEFEDVKSKLELQRKTLENEKTQKAELESQIGLIQTDVETFKKQKRELELQLEELHFKLSGEARARLRIEEERAQYEKEKNDIAAELRNLEQKSKQQYNTIEEELNDIRSKFETTRRNLEQEQSQKLRAENQFQTLQADLDTIQLQKQMLQLQLEEVNFKLSSEIRLRTRAEEERVALETEKGDVITELRNSEQRAKQKYAELQEDLEKLKESYAAFRKEHEEEMEQKVQITKQKETLASKLDDIERTMSSEQVQTHDKIKQMEQSNAQLNKQLEKEKEERFRLERIVTTIQNEKIRVKKRKEAEISWEIEKGITAFTGDKQERGERLVVFLLFEMDKEFCNNLIPSCAFVIHHMISYWKIDEEGSQRLLQLVENTMKATVSSSDSDSLPFWFASITALLQLSSSKDFLSGIPALMELAQREPAEYSVDAIRNKVNSALAESAYITFNMELDMLSSGSDPSNRYLSENDYIRFTLMMANLFTKAYSQTIMNACDVLGRVLKTDMIDGIYLSSQKPFEEVVLAIKNTLQLLHSNHIPEIIVSRIMKQLVTFIDVTIFNEILLRKDICSFAKGNTIKQNIEQLEGEIYTTTGYKEKLSLVRQAIAILLVDKKSLLMNEQTRRKLMPNLNYDQISRILKMYNPGEFENKVSNDVIQYFAKPGPAIEPIFTETSTILDPLAIAPFKSLEELTSIELEDEMPYISFPISLKDKLDKMAQEEARKRQRFEMQHMDLSKVVNSVNLIGRMPSSPSANSLSTPRSGDNTSSPSKSPRSSIATPRGNTSGTPPPNNNQAQAASSSNAANPSARKSFSFWKK
jgi:myosin heavy subunit